MTFLNKYLNRNNVIATLFAESVNEELFKIGGSRGFAP
jgi:hypothetical protein